MFWQGVLVGALTVILAITGLIVLARKWEEEEARKVESLKRPRTERAMAANMDAKAPVPSDLDMPEFHDEKNQPVKDDKRAEKVKQRVQDDWEKGRQAFYSYLKTLTKNENANEVLYTIAVLGPDEWISIRRISKELGWGYRRTEPALKYLRKNGYVHLVDKSKTKGNKYRLTEKSDKKV